MHKRIKNYLNEPFTLFLSYPVGHLYFSLLIIFMSVLINILQPFGLNNWNETHKWLIISGYVMLYAGIYWLMYMICSLLFPDYYNPHCWTRLKELRVLVVYVPLVTIAGWLFTEYAIEELVWTYTTFFRIQFYNCLFGAIILPVFKQVVFPKIKSKHQSVSATVQDNVQLPIQETNTDNYITVKGKRIAVNDLIYVESNRNDVHVWFLDKGKLIEIVERCAMKEFKTRINEFPQFVQCYQSYIVNINYIASWSISDNKMEIQMRSCTKFIPVSRNNQGFMKEVFKSHYILKK